MRRLWLIFAQSATVTLAAVFVLSLVKPGLLPFKSSAVALKAAPQPSGMTLARATPGGFGPGYSEAAKKAIPSVVNIFSSKAVKLPAQEALLDPAVRRLFGDQITQRQRSLGSGVVVSSQGFILTNQHVVEEADEIEVALADGRTAQAAVIGIDPDTDLAVLKVDLENLPAMTFGRSEELKVGDVVLAIGDPFGV
ncbi:MAG: trypsin-like peptidase domain-containing protein, partial [Burkholderiales bacterium]|nr:trypsin-like peptidase domain-containing protein [Burkholderiales bacterium]